MATLTADAVTHRRSAAALVCVLVAFGCALASPAWLLLTAPLLLGVPHLCGDLRCLLQAGPLGVPRSVLVRILVPLATMTALRILWIVNGTSWPRLEIALGVLAVGVGVLGAVRTRIGRRLGALAFAGSACLLVVDPRATNLVLVHGHNFVALAFFAAWARDRREARNANLAALLGTAVLLGAAPFVVEGSGAGGLSWSSLTTSLAPGLPTPLANGVVVVYAFAQAVHYALWIALIPRERGFAPLPWSRPGVRVLAAVALTLVVLVPISAFLDAVTARAQYLAIATFHAWLELAVGGHLLVRRGAP